MHEVKAQSPTLTLDLEDQLKKAYDLRGHDLAQSLRIAQQVLHAFKDIKFESGIAKAENLLGLFHLIRGEFALAEEYSRKALSYFGSQKDIKGIADARYNIGGIYYRTNKYHQGLIELSQCLAAYRQLGDFHNQARTLKSMGTIYEYFNDQEKAIESYEKSIEASREVNDISLESNALNPLSGIYNKQGKSQLAFDVIGRSILLKTQSGDTRGLAFALYGRAKLFIKQLRFEEALTDLEHVAEILSAAEDMLGLGMAYNKIGISYQGLGNLAQALHYFNLALELGEKYKVQLVSFKANFNLYTLAKSEGNMQLALAYLEKYLFQKEEVINNENYNIIKSYEALSKIESLEREAKAQKEKSEIVEKKNAELDSFFYRVSHDLKGPISSLLGLYNVVKLDIKDQKSLNIFDMYHSQAVRMNDIVIGLINLTEIKNTEKLKTNINFEKLVNECIDSCRYLTNFSRVKFEKSISVYDFLAEWAIINTILQNLIENAIKYSRTNVESLIKISVFKDDGHVIMRVEDNGQGIPPEHQSNIFNMFYRATEKNHGSGLGLYILKRAVERTQGDINFVSVPNQGSTFVVRIPYSS
ncbi:MAG: tetratricopeptide repeat-containing sensor histidine kinase [Bacteroidetes bacterium]|nr:tetratricopeptide repeat-containing sensor histidine kinase [Bacteroidota bacterium]